MTQTIKKLSASFLVGLLLSLQLGGAVLAIDDSTTTPTTQTEDPTTTSPSTSPSDPSVTDSAPIGPQDPTGPQGPTGVDPTTTGPQTPTGVDPANTGVGSTPPVTTGPDQPTGAAPDWVFNTATNKWEAADKGSFTWDKTTGYWLSPKYYYDTRDGWYEIIPAGSPKPSYLITAPKPANIISTPIGDFVVGSPEYELAKAMGIIVDPAINGTGPNSSNTATVNNSTTALIDFTNIVRLANNLKSSASSGDANVSGNTLAGDASSGSAAVMANVVNMLSSVWNLSGGPVVTFVKNIFGNFFGDITLDTPDVAGTGSATSGGSSSNTNTGPNSNNQSALNNSNDLTVHVNNDGQIDNNIDLSATSGNANVSGNTVGGNASTGDANVALNLINMINTAISANGSFIGILNVFGDLNGDILFGNDFLSQVLASGGAKPGSNSASNSDTGPNSSNGADINNTNNLNLNASSQTNINNDINSHAQTGNANTGGNTDSGGASTGTANTSSSVMNLDNQNIVGDSAVLVIVNVMGHWLGGIMSLPGNVASALLGSGNSSATNSNTGPNSSNQADVNNASNTNIDVNDKMTINNHVNLEATSGDANVTGNTRAGNATSGNANILSSVANITNTSVNLHKWFGILIVNVFGNWFGSVGKDTAAGNLVADTGLVTASAAPTSGSPVNTASTKATISAGAGGGASQITAAPASSSAPVTKVLGANKALETAQAANGKTSALMFVIAVAIMLFAGGLAILERRLGKVRA